MSTREARPAALTTASPAVTCASSSSFEETLKTSDDAEPAFGAIRAPLLPHVTPTVERAGSTTTPERSPSRSAISIRRSADAPPGESSRRTMRLPGRRSKLDPSLNLRFAVASPPVFRLSPPNRYAPTAASSQAISPAFLSMHELRLSKMYESQSSRTAARGFPEVQA